MSNLSTLASENKSRIRMALMYFRVSSHKNVRPMLRDQSLYLKTVSLYNIMCSLLT